MGRKLGLTGQFRHFIRESSRNGVNKLFRDNEREKHDYIGYESTGIVFYSGRRLTTIQPESNDEQ
jgi:hypothetical protein